MATERYAPFKAHQTGSVKAHGKISGVQIHQDGKTAEVTVRHEAPKEKSTDGGKDSPIGAFPYPQETRATMPAALAKRFTAGQHVAVHVGPADEIGATEGDGGEEETEKGGGDMIRKAAKAKKSA